MECSTRPQRMQRRSNANVHLLQSTSYAAELVAASHRATYDL
jgi:hypothetical protein